MNCTLRTTTPSLSLPAWVRPIGVQPEVHVFLGNRGPPELTSLLLSLTRAQRVRSVGGTPWFVDLVRSKVAPLQVTRRHHHRHHHPPPPPPPPPPLPPLPLPPSCRATDPSRPHTRSSGAHGRRRRRRRPPRGRVHGGARRRRAARVGAILGDQHGGHLDGVQFSGIVRRNEAVFARHRFQGRAPAEAVARIDARSDVPTNAVVLSDHGHLDRGGAGTSAAERDVPFSRGGGVVGRRSRARAVPGGDSIRRVRRSPPPWAPVPRHPKGGCAPTSSCTMRRR